MNQVGTSYHRGIDGLKGVFTLYIFSFHAIASTLASQPAWLRFFFGGMKFTLPVFFLLSGFLLTQSYLTTSERGVLPFLLRRFARIWPLYLICVLFLWWRYELSPWSIFLQLSFLFGFVMYDPQHLPNVEAWSLFNEEVFYLVTPLLLYKINKLRSLVILIGSALLYYYWMSMARDWGVPETNHFISRFFLANLVFFCAGITCYFVREDKTALGRPVGWFFLFALGGGAAVIYPPLVRLPVALICFLIALNPIGPLSKVFKATPLCWVGRRCYFIYLFHGLALRHWARLFPPTSTAGLLSNVLLLGILLLAAGVSWSYFERPCMDWMRSKIREKFAN